MYYDKVQKKYKKFLIPVLTTFLLLTFTFNVSARNGWNRKLRPTSTPITTLTPTVTASSTPTAIPTVTPTITPSPTLVATSTPTAGTTNATVYVTYYGWPDNDPAGNAIAYPKSDGYPSIHEGASGTGTFDNPVTFAAKVGRFPIGTKIYVPYIKKYVVLEDTCASCTTNWIDIWMESDGNNTSKVIACEEHWTKENVPVEINAPAGREVSVTPLFDKSTGICQN
jgi:3D (Asp-Asp-Asp) domain-containing protein